MAAEDRAVVVHLVRLIQDSADVRHVVGGPCTRMRELLVAAIKAAGFDGDPLEALKPASHHADEEPRVVHVERDRDRLENGVEAVRVALRDGAYQRALQIVERLQAGEHAQ